MTMSLVRRFKPLHGNHHAVEPLLTLPLIYIINKENLDLLFVK